MRKNIVAMFRNWLRTKKENYIWKRRGRTTEQISGLFNRYDLKRMEKYGVVKSRFIRKGNGQIIKLWRFDEDIRV